MSAELHLPNLSTTPPNGWRFFVAETGKWVKGNNLGAVVAAAANHYAANNLPSPLNLEAVIEKQICDAYPDYCQPLQPNLARFPVGIRRTVAMIVSGTRTIGSWMIAGRPLVTPDVAETRAAVCAKCPQNQKPDGCTGCSMASLRQVVEHIIGGARTTHDERLFACWVCGCQIRAKIQLPHEILEKNMPPDVFAQLPEHCWLQTEKVKD